jgi:hypothetical protein
MWTYIGGFDRTDKIGPTTIQITQTLNDPMPTAKFRVSDQLSQFLINGLQEVVILDENGVANQTINQALDPILSSFNLGQVLWPLQSSFISTPPTQTHTGSSPVQVTIDVSPCTTTGTFYYTQQSLLGTVVAGQTYTFSLTVTRASINNSKAQLLIQFTDANGNVLGTATSDIATAGTGRIALTATAPAGTVFSTIMWGVNVTSVATAPTGQYTFSLPQFEPQLFAKRGISYPTPLCNQFQANCYVLPNGYTVRQTRLFAGFISRVSRTYTGKQRRWQVEAFSLMKLLDSTYFSGTFSGMTDALMISNILANANYAVHPSGSAVRLITQKNLISTMTMPTMTFDGVSILDALKQIAAISGCSFYVDHYGDLHYFPWNYISAPFELSDQPDQLTSYPGLVLGGKKATAYYRLGEASGAVTLDSSGNGFSNTTISGGVTLAQPGAIATDVDTSMLFNGTSGSIALDSRLNVGGLTAFSVELWFNLSNNTFSNFPRAITDGWTGTANKGFEIEFANAAGGITFDVGNGSTRAQPAYVATLSAGVWYHVVGTYDGANARLYINGNLQTTAAMTGALQAGVGPITIGNLAGAGQTNWFPGRIDEVSLDFGTALSAAQITARYNAGIQPAAKKFAYSELQIDEDASQPKSRILLQGGSYTPTWTDSFTGDGTTKQFTLTQLTPQTPISITVGGTTQKVGINGQHTFSQGYNALLDINGHFILFNVAPGNTVAVFANYAFVSQIRTRTWDLQSIANTYGIAFDATVQDSNISSSQEALQRAIGEIEDYSDSRIVLHFKTQKALVPGQIVPITSALDNLSSTTYLVQKVVTSPGGGDYIEYQVDAGAYIPDIIAILKNLHKMSALEQINYSNSAAIALLQEDTVFQDALTLSDSFSFTTAASNHFFYGNAAAKYGFSQYS